MRAVVLRLMLGALVVAGCDGLEPPTDPQIPPTTQLIRHWRYTWETLDSDSLFATPWRTAVNGVVSDSRDWGPMELFPPDRGPNALGEVFSDETGFTYWASTQMPHEQYLDPASTIATSTELEQVQWFRKDSDDAFLEFVISGVLLELIDANPWLPMPEECPWIQELGELEDCTRLMLANAFFEQRLFAVPNSDTAVCGRTQDNDLPCIHSIAGDVELAGIQGRWEMDASTATSAFWPLWTDDDFVLDPDADGTSGGSPGRHATVRLREPLRLRVPVDAVETGTDFRVETYLSVVSANVRQRESYAGAFLRDPARADGLGMEFSGLTPVSAPFQPPTDSILQPPPLCSAEGPYEGVIAFGLPEVQVGERFRTVRIPVTRTGGARGAIAALLSSRDGTAMAGADYEEVSSYVLFADGEQGERIAVVRLHPDSEEEPTETLDLTLSRGDGCASIGGGANMRVTILDDDGPLPQQPTYTVGGTVSGLIGSGLVLTLNSTNDISPGNGEFVFARDFPDRLPYFVRVASQPESPAQACEVLNGEGTIAGADVTNIQVVCSPPIGSSGLDPSFGDGGKVVTGLSGLLGGATDIAVQDDGRIVAVGGGRVARYHPDGAVDTTFGDNGEVSVDVYPGADRLDAVEVTPDGRILAAGYSRDGVNSPTQEDWIVVRLLPDGSRDPAFGSGGHVILDFDERGDAATGILLPGDGSIVVTGTAAVAPTGVSDYNLAAVRLTEAGQVDPAFGTGGRTVVNVAGPSDQGFASALQPDGKILVAGRVAISGGTDPDVGVIRLNVDGTLDDTFGSDGILRPVTDGWDEAADVLVQPDGGIVLLVHTGGGAVTLARYLADGSSDIDFGAGGEVFQPRATIARAIALQADGSIVAAASGSQDFLLFRVSGDGVLDSSFGEDGLIRVDFFGGSDSPAAVEVLADGAILVAGEATNGTSRSIGMAKVLP